MSIKRALFCDKHEEDRLAIGTFLFTNGNGTTLLKADLCQPCVDETIMSLMPSKAQAKAHSTVNGETKEERKKRLDRERHAKKRDERKKEQPLNTRSDYWAVVEAKIMKVMKDLKEQVHINDVIKGAGISNSSAGNGLRRLVAAKKIEARGGAGRYRRYWLPA